MTTTRRSILATLFSAPLAKLWSKTVKSKVGQSDLSLYLRQMRDVSIGNLYKELDPSPCPLPFNWHQKHVECLLLGPIKAMYWSCCFWSYRPRIISVSPQVWRAVGDWRAGGLRHPRIISVSPQAWRDIWGSLAPHDRFVVSDSDLAKAGWQTLAFEEAEIVCDPQLSGNQLWFISPSKRDSFDHNGLLTYETNGITPRRYTPPTPEEVAEWRDEYEDYADD